ncbi:MAG TPA: YhjD/YihY/BrkB family envelope integrity protein [Solirubrobacteraceae bacterium]|jgi:membrane protein
MHFLLAGRVPWRALLRTAVVTALLWLGIALFSSLYFSSTVISDNKQFGTIGVVFSLLTWFILIGFAFVLGAAFGAVWQKPGGRRIQESGGQRQSDEGSDGPRLLPRTTPS